MTLPDALCIQGVEDLCSARSLKTKVTAAALNNWYAQGISDPAVKKILQLLVRVLNLPFLGCAAERVAERACVVHDLRGAAGKLRGIWGPYAGDYVLS